MADHPNLGALLGPLLERRARSRLRSLFEVGRYELNEGMFDPRFIRSDFFHQGELEARDRIERELKELGAPPTCVVFGPLDDLHQQTVPLRRALDALVSPDEWNHNEAVLICLPRRLAYYQSHNGLAMILYHPS